MRIRTRGAAAVEETWRRFVPSARLQQVDPQSFSFDWTSLQMPGFALVGYELAASVESAVKPEDQLMVCRVATRSGWVGSAQGDVDRSLPWVASDSQVRARWSGAANVRAFVFDLDHAEQTARQISGDDRLDLRMTDASPVTRAAGRQWETTYAYLFHSLIGAGEAAAARDGDGDDPGGADDMTPMEAELRRHAIAATLSAFPSTFLDAIERPAQLRAAPATVRRAMAFMDDHAHEPITIDDVALAARISTRGLQYAFRRALGVTPTEYLRDVRLAGAHAELQRGGGAASVGDIARRWGFPVPSRFAKYYRGAYGRSPSETLRLG